MDNVLTEIMQKFTTSDKGRKIYENKWDTLYSMYRFKLQKSRPGRSNFYVPHAFSNVETVFPRMTSKRPRTLVKPQGPSDVEAAGVLNKLVEYAWERAHLDAVVRRWVKGSLIYGTGIVKVSWQKKTKKETKRKPVTKGGKVSYEESTTPVVKYDDIKVANLDIRDIYIDNDAVTVQDAKYIIHRYWSTRDEIESNPAYDKGDLKSVQYGASNDKIARGLSATEKKKADESSYAEVLEYWEDDRLAVVAGGVVVQDGPNPYDCKKKPFVAMVDQIDDQVLYGIGEVEPIEGIQRELNTLRNQRMDFNNLTLNPTFKVMPNAVTDEDSIMFAPGHKIFMNTNDPGAITAIEMPQLPFTSYKEEEAIRMDLQTITGVSDYARGSDATRMNETATGISLIQEAANERFNAKVRNMEQAIGEMVELMVALYQQYITKERVFRITEDETDYFETIKPEDIKGQFDIFVEKGSSLPSNKMQKRSEEMNKYNVLSASPLVQQSPELMAILTKSLINAWEDPEKDELLQAIQSAVEDASQAKEAAMLEQQIAQEEAGLANEMGMPQGGNSNEQAPEPGPTFPTE
jgi:hypothetical protein